MTVVPPDSGMPPPLTDITWRMAESDARDRRIMLVRVVNGIIGIIGFAISTAIHLIFQPPWWVSFAGAGVVIVLWSVVLAAGHIRRSVKDRG
jgi:hypothetical protein